MPTRNYVAVHARGALSWLHDEAWLVAVLDELMSVHEAARTEPWRVSEAPAEFTAAMRRNAGGWHARHLRELSNA